jgi:hypothetical protein
VARMYRDHPLEGAVNEGLATRRSLGRQLAAEMEQASRGAAARRGSPWKPRAWRS